MHLRKPGVSRAAPPARAIPARATPARALLRAACLASALALPLAGPAPAQTTLPLSGLATDPAAPVQIEADRLEVSQSDGSARFSGNVLVVQGDLRLTAGLLLVEYAPPAEGTSGARGRIRKLTASGGVLLATASEQAEAAEAVYDVAARRITMSGDVLLTQGGSILSGEGLVVNLDDGTGAMSGRVRTVLDPPAR